MKKLNLLLLVALTILLSRIGFAQTITVDGNAYLECQTSHDSIMLTFERTVPSTLYDTAYTDISGYFNKTLQTGIYNVTYSKTGYISIFYIDLNFYSDYTFADTTLLNKLSGQLSGVINPCTYYVIGNIEVANGDTLIIEPGVTMLYYTSIGFDINGLLIAEGTETDSIKFTRYDTTVTWEGIDFHYNADDNSILSYCLVEYSNRSGIYCNNSNPTLTNLTIQNNSAYYGYGGGIFCDTNSNPILTDVTIQGNSASWGGGILCYTNSNPTLNNVTIQGNFASLNGGGIYCNNSNPTLNNVTIQNNSADYGGGIRCYKSSPTLTNVTIQWNSADYSYGGGIYCESSNPTLNNVTIQNNSAVYFGGGIFCQLNSNPSLTNVTIQNNSAVSGGGFSCHSSDPTLTNVTIKNNSADYDGGGIYCYANSDPTLTNVTIQNNSADYGGGIYSSGDYSSPTIVNSIISDNNNYGIFVGSGNPSILYSNFWNNSLENFYNCDTYVGINITVNANGDSIDPYGNMQLDPMFADAVNGDFHLQPNSPCIDAGINDSVYIAYDFDGNIRIWDGNGDGDTIVDMGVYEFDAPLYANLSDNPKLSDKLIDKITIFPNPANTIINFKISETSNELTIKLFDIYGRLLLVTNWSDDKSSDKFIKGQIDLSNYPKGIYCLRFEGRDFVKTEKVVLQEIQ